MGYFYSQQQWSLALGLVSCLDWDFLQAEVAFGSPPQNSLTEKLVASAAETRLSLSPHVSTETCSVSWSGEMERFVCSGRFICSVGSCRKLNPAVLWVRGSLSAPAGSVSVGKAGMDWGLQQINFKYSGWTWLILENHPHHPWAVLDKAGLVQAGPSLLKLELQSGGKASEREKLTHDSTN